DNTGVTRVDDLPAGAAARRDPISDIIARDRRPAARGPAARVPSLDDPDEEDDTTPLPPPSRGTTAADEAAALSAIDDLDAQKRASSAKLARKAAAPIVDPIQDLDVPTPKLRSPLKSAVTGIVVLGVLGGAGYMVYSKFQDDKAREAQAKVDREQQ